MGSYMVKDLFVYWGIRLTGQEVSLGCIHHRDLADLLRSFTPITGI